MKLNYKQLNRYLIMTVYTDFKNTDRVMYSFFTGTDEHDAIVKVKESRKYRKNVKNVYSTKVIDLPDSVTDEEVADMITSITMAERANLSNPN